MKYLKKHVFLWDYIRESEFPECYKELAIQGKSYRSKNNKKELTKLPLITRVSLFPDFLTPKIVGVDAFTLKTVHHYGFNGAGTYIDLNKNYSIDAYMNTHFKRQLRVNIKRYIKRLETSFNIQYEYNFGDISQNKYDVLMLELKNMLTKRFKQKHIKNHFLANWKAYTNNIYNLINKSKASLFVIYDDQKPISISLNYHEKNTILFSHVSSFDIDYIKFGLGHLDNYLLLNWCLKNKYRFLDLGTGISDYKAKWCNTFYSFEYHLFYKKNSILSSLILYIEIFKIKTKNIVKSTNIKGLASNIRDSLYTNKEFKSNSTPQYTIELIDIKKTDITLLKEININTTEYQNLRLPTYNYLYSSQENINDISLFQIETEIRAFIIKSKKDTLKVVFNT